MGSSTPPPEFNPKEDASDVDTDDDNDDQYDTTNLGNSSNPSSFII